MMRKFSAATLLAGLILLGSGCMAPPPSTAIRSSGGGSGDALGMGIHRMAQDNPGVYVETKPQVKPTFHPSDVATIPSEND